VPHALIVEDDPDSAEMLEALVAANGFATAIAGTLHDARRQLGFRPPDVVLLDLNLPDGSGIDLFDAMNHHACQIVLITGQASIETSIQALRLGATDYLIKPINVDRLRAVLARVAAAGRRPRPAVGDDATVEREGRYGSLWGRSASMRKVYQQIARVAPTAVTVLVTGESGTGKELVAQTIHDASTRAGGPFLAVNCGALSPQLIESELFGHEKGSFTGAVRQHHGFFERADGGSLFLDEVTEMSMELQVKLLRVLETGSFTPVGGDTPVTTDVRIIAATNRDPLEAVADGQLREDLYYRLAVFPISLPPLRERRDDIALIARHFLAKLNDRDGERKDLSETALQQLRRYDWPGNVRELRNAIHRGHLLADGDTIGVADLPRPAPDAASFRAAPGTAADPGPAVDPGIATNPAPAASAGLAVASPPPAAGAPPLGIAIGTPIAAAEKALILATLAHCGGHRERAAAMLGISVKTLYNRVKRYEAEAAGQAGSADGP